MRILINTLDSKSPNFDDLESGFNRNLDQTKISPYSTLPPFLMTFLKFSLHPTTSYCNHVYPYENFLHSTLANASSNRDSSNHHFTLILNYPISSSNSTYICVSCSYLYSTTCTRFELNS